MKARKRSTDAGKQANICLKNTKLTHKSDAVSLYIGIFYFVLKFGRTVATITQCRNNSMKLRRNPLFNTLLCSPLSLRKSDVISITGPLWTA